MLSYLHLSDVDCDELVNQLKGPQIGCNLMTSAIYDKCKDNPNRLKTNHSNQVNMKKVAQKLYFIYNERSNLKAFQDI